MQKPLEITFRNLDHSAAVEQRVRVKAAKLEHYCDDILRCHVVIERAHARHHRGNLYDVKITVAVPDTELVVSHGSGDEHAHEDVYVSIRDAFDVMRGQLEDYVRRRRGDVKRHSAQRRTGPRRRARAQPQPQDPTPDSRQVSEDDVN
jgi:ribosomal subunit interface protein